MDETIQREPEINKVLRLARKYSASDVYLEVGSAPRMRLRGNFRGIDVPPMTREELDRLVAPLLYAEQLQRLSQGEEIVFTYAFEEGDAYEVAVSSAGGQLRLIAHRIGPE